MKIKQLSGLQKDSLVAACLALLVCLLYSNTYHVTWYFDDTNSIIGNENVYAFSNPLRTLLLPRGPALLSFALNYALHGESLPGYHLVNNLIHIIASIIVYLLLKRVTDGSRAWAFFGAVVFLVHPIQTQAVTYVVQRMTSLAALFAFLCVYCFVRGREALAKDVHFSSLRHVCWYLGMFVTCALAVLTKQNTAFLPLGLYVFGRYFIDERQGWSRGRSMVYLTPFLLLPALAAYPILIAPLLNGVSLTDIGFTDNGIAPVRYFVSEWQVLLVYLRLLCVPLGQTLDYAYPPVSGSLLTVTTALCGTLLLALMYVAYRVRRSAGPVSFAIVWFFLSLAVESSFIPLDLLFEHRLYITMFGFVIMLVWLMRLIRHRQIQIVLIALLLCGYSLLTFQRNALWADPIAFYEDNLRKAPHNERAYVEVSRLYIEQKRYGEAEACLKKGLLVKPGAAQLYDNLGVLYYLRGELDRAIGVFNQGIARTPGYEKLYVNLAVVYATKSDFIQAEKSLLKALSIRPTDPSALFNLGVNYYKMGNKGQALASFRSALAHAPYNADVMFYLAITAFETGDRELARSVMARLQPIDAARVAELTRHFP